MDVVSHRTTFRASQLAGFGPDIRTSPMERTADSVFSVFHGVLVGGSLIGTFGFQVIGFMRRSNLVPSRCPIRTNCGQLDCNTPS